MNNHEIKRPRELRGLYKNVNISVKTLDIIIVLCIAVIIGVVALNLLDPGFTITFDSRGGSDIPPITADYGELLSPPLPPTREGYHFSGWYKDPSYDLMWDFNNDIIEGDITLYAGWDKIK